MNREGIQRARAVSYNHKGTEGLGLEWGRRAHGAKVRTTKVWEQEYAHVNSGGIKGAVGVSRPLVQRNGRIQQCRVAVSNKAAATIGNRERHSKEEAHGAGSRQKQVH